MRDAGMEQAARKQEWHRYGREAFADFWPEAEPLVREHYHEVAHYQDIPLEVDVESYIETDEVGLLRVFTARELDGGALVGYVIYLVGPNLHYKNSKQAKQDALFVHPRARTTNVGSKLVKFSELSLAHDGVQVVYQHTKVTPELDLRPFYEHLGYELIDHVYGKRLD